MFIFSLTLNNVYNKYSNPSKYKICSLNLVKLVLIVYMVVYELDPAPFKGLILTH